MVDSQADLTEPKPPGPPVKRAARLGILVVIASGLLLGTVVLRQITPRRLDGERHPAVGSVLPELELAPLTGTTGLTKDALEGKVSVLNFWGPWCFYCRVEFPSLVSLERDLRNRADFQFVSISCPGGTDSADVVGLRSETVAYLKTQGAEFDVYADPRETTRLTLARAARLPDFVYPTTVVVDRTRKIRGLWQGYAEGDEQHIDELVRRLLDE